MARRQVKLTVTTKTVTADTIKRCARQHLEASADAKVMVYTNQKDRAKANICNMLEGVLKNIEGGGDVIPIHGDTSVIMKSLCVGLFSGELEIDGITLRAVPITAAAIYGVNSKLCKALICDGPPACLVDWVQLAGRPARVPRAADDPLPDECHIVITVSTWCFLLKRAHLCENQAERKRQEQGALEVLKFLMLPCRCLHLMLEGMFQMPGKRACEDGGEATPCGNMCSFCLGQATYLPIYKVNVISLLSTRVFHYGPVAAMDLVAAVFSAKDQVWGAAGMTARKVERADVHALILQMIAAELLQWKVKSPPKTSKKKGTLGSVLLNWAVIHGLHNDEIPTLAHSRGERWSRIALHAEESKES